MLFAHPSTSEANLDQVPLISGFTTAMSIFEGVANSTSGYDTFLVSTTPASPPAASSTSVAHMRMALTITHLSLVSMGSVNLVVIFVILLRPYMRSITNVYMLSLCLADFIYLVNLTLVAATQINEKSWPFSSFMCTMYHGTETTGKYASVMFVVLLAADRYCAMCRANWCARYRNYRTALAVSALAWILAIAAAFPLYIFSEVALLRTKNDHLHKLCIAKWPNSDIARWYITFSSVFIFALPLALIIFCYYHILNKLREALKSCKRLRRDASSRAPYHRVTRLVLWVVVFHVICWTPFWLFNLFSSIFRLRITTQFDRVVVNIIHLFPYINCALNPLLYAVNAENFRHAFHSVFCRKRSSSELDDGHIGFGGVGFLNSTRLKTSGVTGGSPNAGHIRRQHRSSALHFSSNRGSTSNHTTSSEKLIISGGGSCPPSILVQHFNIAGASSHNGTVSPLINTVTRSVNGHLDVNKKLPGSKHSINIVFSSPDITAGLVTQQLTKDDEKLRNSVCGQAVAFCGSGVATATAFPDSASCMRMLCAKDESRGVEKDADTDDLLLRQPLDEINASEEMPPDMNSTNLKLCSIGLGIGLGIGSTSMANDYCGGSSSEDILV